MGRGKSKDATEFWLRYAQLTDKDLPVIIATGIPRSTLSTYKSEKRFPKGDEIVAIAKFLNVTAEWLVTGKDSSDSWINDHRDFFSKINTLTPEQMHTVEAMVEGIVQMNTKEISTKHNKVE